MLQKLQINNNLQRCLLLSSPSLVTSTRHIHAMGVSSHPNNSNSSNAVISSQQQYQPQQQQQYQYQQQHQYAPEQQHQHVATPAVSEQQREEAVQSYYKEYLAEEAAINRSKLMFVFYILVSALIFPDMIDHVVAEDFRYRLLAEGPYKKKEEKAKSEK